MHHTIAVEGSGLGASSRLSQRVHLVINPTSANHNLVSQVHQLEVGEGAQPLVLTPPGVFLAAAEGRLTAAPFSLTTDQHSHTMVSCKLRQKQLQKGQHMKKRCKLRAQTWRAEAGWAPEAG